MPSRPSRSSKAVSASSQQPAEPESAPRQAPMRQEKAELVEVLVEPAELDRGMLRQLAARFDVAPPPDELLSATRRAIVDATDFDVRQINRNFAYDHAAYGEVERNLRRLIGSGELRQAMTLAPELMKRGSYEVEMSDEGMRAGELGACLSELIGALKTCDLAASEVRAWCSTMLKTDRAGFIAREPIEALHSHWQTIAAS